MRNLLEYPVTSDEVQQTLQRLIEQNDYPNTGCGDMTSTILRMVKSYLQGDGCEGFEDYLFEERP